LNPRVKPIATPANDAILKFLEVVVAITYAKVNVITVSTINALIMLFSEGKVTLTDIAEPNIAYTTAAPITAPID
jgi:ArsR family metal-binding transcriptional regulator